MKKDLKELYRLAFGRTPKQVKAFELYDAECRKYVRETYFK